MVDAGVVVAGLISVGALIVLSALRSLATRQRVQRELAAVQAGKYPAWQAYARYRSAVRPGSESRASLILLFFVGIFALTLVVSDSPLGLSGILNILTVPANAALLLICVATGLTIATILPAVIVAIVGDAPAYRLLRGGVLRTSTLAVRRLKSHLPLRLMLLLALDGCAALYWVGVPWVVCLALFCVLYVTLLLARVRLAEPLQRWVYAGKPLQETQWAALASRVAFWAQKAGQPTPAVFVCTGPTEGFGNSSTMGGSPGTLILNEDFLANSDWRQQGALLCWLLVARAPLMRQSARVVTLYGGIVLVLCLVLGVTIGVSSRLTSADFTADVTTSLLESVLPIVLILVILFGFSFASKWVNRRARSIFRDADRRAAELTGDPWAVMTMLATMDTLVLGIPALGIVATGPVPQRLADIAALSLAPGPRAPWAYTPVPSLQPVFSGTYPITMPLGPQVPIPAASPNQ